MFIKSLSLSILLTITYIGFSQKSTSDVEPYIKTKSGELIKYEEVRITFFGNVVGLEKNIGWVKYKPKDLSSVLVGKKEWYKRDKHLQLIYLKLNATNKIKGEGTYLPGNRPYQILFNNGEDMIITDKIRNSRPWNSSTVHYTHTSYDESGKRHTHIYNYDVFLLKDGKYKKSKIISWKNNPVDEVLSDLTSDCDCYNLILKAYENISIYKQEELWSFLFGLKDCYFEKCFVEI